MESAMLFSRETVNKVRDREVPVKMKAGVRKSFRVFFEEMNNLTEYPKPLWITPFVPLVNFKMGVE